MIEVPPELRERRQWLVWRLETRDGKPTKVPYSATGAAGSTTDPATWSSFEQAAAAEGFSGIGYVFSEDADQAVVPGGGGR